MLFAFVMMVGPVWAHALLEKAVPAVGGTASAVHDIRLTFSEGVEPAFSTIKLSSATGEAIPASAPALDPNDSHVLVLDLAADLPAGDYKVTWAVVSVDTHHTSGTFTFTAQP